MSLKNISKRENKAAQLEVKLLASLHHPNIVSYKESFIDPGSLIFIVMGFCEGGDMYHLIRARQGVPIDENLVIEWFIQISMALQVFLFHLNYMEFIVAFLVYCIYINPQ